MNISWTPDPAAVERANARPWGSATARIFRPLDYGDALRTTVAGTIIYLMASVTIALWANSMSGVTEAVFVVSGSASLVCAVVFAGMGLGLSPELYMRLFPFAAVVGLSSGAVIVALNVIYGGAFAVGLLGFTISAIAFGFYLLRLAAAITLTALYAAAIAIALLQLGVSVDDGLVLWFQAVGNMTVTGALIGMIAARLRRTVVDEHSARTSLATLARDLEDQVRGQVDELERLGQLRRFLSPQIADAVLSGGSEAILGPHRRRIAAFFCDLRGFTAFTGSAEPEEVVGMLGEYYETVGKVLRRHQATIGGYEGDGIMAFFGDPVVSESPAKDAVAAVQELIGELELLVKAWERRDVPVSFGIGLAYGYATLGEVGFDDRVDYTALGTVVNLAARLCDKAAPGQVLMDHATALEAEGLASLTPVDGLDLKGMPAGTKAYALD